MKAEPPPLRIANPCPKNWDDMSGDAKRRFCEQCQLHVHNLSAMSAGERTRFVQDPGPHACITYEIRPDGTMVTSSRWDWVVRPLRAVAALLAAMLPFAFSSCATRRTAGVPVPPGSPSHHSACEKPGTAHITGEIAPTHAPQKLGKFRVMGDVPTKEKP